MPLRPHNGLPIALKMDFGRPNGLPIALEMKFGRPNGLPIALKMDFGQPNGLPIAPNGLPIALEMKFGRPNRLLIALEMKFGRPNSIFHVFQAAISLGEHTLQHEKAPIPPKNGPRKRSNPQVAVGRSHRRGLRGIYSAGLASLRPAATGGWTSPRPWPLNSQENLK